MHAIRHYEFGSPDVFRWEHVETPIPGPGQVRITVRAAGVHFIDTSIRRGEQRGPFPPPELPMTPGREVAGVVDAVGDGVEASWVDRRVVAYLGMASGGYAEAVVCAVESLHELDEHVADADAVAMIGTGRTTMGILEAAAVSEGDVAVVLAASGGIGCLLIQSLDQLGATVVGGARGRDKVDVVRDLDADLAIDYSKRDWIDEARSWLGGRSVTMLFAGTGGQVAEDALGLLQPGGRVLRYGWDVDDDELTARGFDVPPVLGPALMQRPGGLRSLEEAALGELAAGRWKPVVNPPFPLSDAAAAHAALEARATLGKVVLVP